MFYVIIMENLLTDNISQWGSGLMGQILSIVVLMIFFSLYSRIMVQQIMFKLEKSASALEEMTSEAEKHVLKRIRKKPDKKVRSSVKNFLEFFVIPPVDIDPYGVMKKLEHIVNQEKYRFKYFVNEIATESNEESKANIMMGLSGAMNLYQLTKIVRHFVELIKKTKSINLAFIIQMQLPFIERMAKALLHGTEALSNGWVIGDGIGPYIASNLIGDSKVESVDDETVIARRKIKNRNVIIMKAKGPGGRTGNPGKALEKIAKKEKIAKIISIDAAAKLEGEKTGTIAEGVGVAMGGIGVERYQIEDVVVKHEVSLDSIIVKMSAEEAIMPMRRHVRNGTKKVLELVEKSIQRTPDKGSIVIIGVGNTSGVGNNKKSLEESDKIISANIKKIALRAKMRKKGFRFKLPF